MLSYAYAMKITRDAIRARDAKRALTAARVAPTAPPDGHASVALRLEGGASVRVVDAPPSWHRR